ncbi:hypothetical protein [Sphingomonas astaxanthinifaciens]|uniref:hypothetical protein n=1 Tax=Sphingomonas astaxanthinifaciens TaxID=407019 RepID=UPI0004A76DFA|nr:hypothetical protein [Sphingomonas astaxanthinifaciens]
MELGKHLSPAAALRSDELGAVLASLGPNGDSGSRLAAVVALLTGNGSAAGPRGGAFADARPNVTEAFTSGLHNCLRGAPVNNAQQDASKIGLRKQC